MATVVEFTKRFPEFGEQDDERVQMFLDDAEALMADATRWLEYYDVAQLYYAAHLLTIALSTETGDSSPLYPLAHQEVDDVVIKNAVANVNPYDEDLLSTAYGKRYIHYRRLVFVGIIGV